MLDCVEHSVDSFQLCVVGEDDGDTDEPKDEQMNTGHEDVKPKRHLDKVDHTHDACQQDHVGNRNAHGCIESSAGAEIGQLIFDLLEACSQCPPLFVVLIAQVGDTGLCLGCHLGGDLDVHQHRLMITERVSLRIEPILIECLHIAQCLRVQQLDEDVVELVGHLASIALHCLDHILLVQFGRIVGRARFLSNDRVGWMLVGSTEDAIALEELVARMTIEQTNLVCKS